MLFSLKVGVA